MYLVDSKKIYYEVYSQQCLVNLSSIPASILIGQSVQCIFSAYTQRIGLGNKIKTKLAYVAGYHHGLLLLLMMRCVFSAYFPPPVNVVCYYESNFEQTKQ